MPKKKSARRAGTLAGEVGVNGEASLESVAQLHEQNTSDRTTNTGAEIGERSIIEEVSELDAAWFEAHPDHACYIRPLIFSEYGRPEERRYSHVLVIQVQPGFRVRAALRIFSESDAPLTQLVFAPTGERWRVDPDGALSPIPPTTRKPWQAFLLRQAERQVRQ